MEASAITLTDSPLSTMEEVIRKPDPLSLPFEVFEMLIGAVSFVDLPYFLQTSKAINVQST